VRAALQEFGLDADAIEREVFVRYFGKGISDVLMWDCIEAHIGQLPDGIQAAFQRNEKAAMASVEAMTGAREAVELVSGMVPVCVASSGSHEKMAVTLEGRLRDKIMFGSDYPSMPYERLLREWSEIGYSDELLEQILHGNAKRILGLWAWGRLGLKGARSRSPSGGASAYAIRV
jgi:hypothetical protein